MCLLWLAGTLAPGLHHALVRHAYCEVHGALEHADHAELAHSLVRAEPSSGAPGPSAAVASESRTLEHEACCVPVPGERVQRAALERPTTSVVYARCCSPSLPPAQARAPSIPLVRLAPKHSPPA